MNMMQTAQLPPALEALMSMGARPTAPGPGGQPVPTVAANIAQQQSPAGIEAVMPGVQQQAMNMAQAQQPVMMGQLPPQLQQAIQQARGPQGQGVAGLPAPNMSFADGGVVGYAGPEGSFIGVTPTYQDARRLGIDLSPYDPPEVRKEKLERLQKAREFEEQRKSFGEIPTEESVARDAALQAAYPGKNRDLDVIRQVQPGRTAAPPMAASPEGQSLAQNINAQTAFDLRQAISPEFLQRLRAQAERVGGKERQDILNQVAELESRMPSAAPQAAQASTGVASLVERPTQDKASVETAGKQYSQQTQDRIKRMEEIERRRSELSKSMPDLNAEGIAALESANRAREEMLAQQRGDDKFNRRMALYREIGGRDRDAYGRAVANQQARDQAANQADLLHKQAVIKLREAQQAKQLGQFDRAIAFEKEAAELENKANDFELRRKQIAAQMATNEFSGLVSLRGQDMQAQRELKSMAPAEQMMAERAINDWLAKNPGKSYSDGVEWYKNIGRGVGERADAARERNAIARQKLLNEDMMYANARMAYVNATDPAKKAEALRKMKEIERLNGIVDEGEQAPAATQLPPGVTVKRVGP
jgi:hypothetical protein